MTLITAARVLAADMPIAEPHSIALFPQHYMFLSRKVN